MTTRPGYLQGKAALGAFVLSIPGQAVGANKVHLDLFNGSAVPLILKSLEAIKDGSVAITGELGVKLIATRTTAVGTGGTAAVAEGTDPTVPALTKTDPDLTLPSGVTARAAPTGGATAGAVLGEGQVFGEETNAASYEPVELIDGHVTIAAGTGIRVVQGAVAATGNVGFRATFAV